LKQLLVESYLHIFSARSRAKSSRVTLASGRNVPSANVSIIRFLNADSICAWRPNGRKIFLKTYTLLLERVETIAAVKLALFEGNPQPVPGAVIVGAAKSLLGSRSKSRSEFGMPRDLKFAMPPSLVPAATEITHGAFA